MSRYFKWTAPFRVSESFRGEICFLELQIQPNEGEIIAKKMNDIVVSWRINLATFDSKPKQPKY
jgi:hypothetical protein